MKITILIMIFSVSSFMSRAQADWTKIDGISGGRVYDLFVNESGNMFASTLGGLYYSDNNGDSWQLTLDKSTRSTFQSSENIVYTLGLNFSLYRGIAPNLEEVGKTDYLRYIREMPDGMLVAYGGRITVDVYTSSNQGQTWVKSYEFTDLSVFDVRYFEIDSNSRIYIGTSEGLYRSDDIGVTFNPQNSGITFDGIGGPNEVVAMTSDLSGSLYRATQSRVFKSEDNGDSWTSIYCSLPDAWIYGGIVATDNSLILLNAYNGKVMILENGATDWDLVSEFTLSHEYSKKLLYNPVTSTLFYPSEKIGIYKSTDYGITWEYGDNGINSVGFNEMFLGENNDITLLCDYGYRSYNNKTWTRDYFDGYFLRDSQLVGLDLSSIEGQIMVHGNDVTHYFTSSNDGLSWISNTISEFVYTKLVLLFNSDYYAFGTLDYNSPLTVLKSSNNGLSWDPIEIVGLEVDSYATLNGFAKDESQNILYASFGGGIETPAAMYKIDLVSNTAEVLSDDYVYRLNVASDHSLWGILDTEEGIKVATYDTSISDWKIVYDASSFLQMEITHNDYILLMEDGGKIVVSPTKGRTWRDISIQSSGQIGDIAMDEAGIVYSAVSYDGVYKTNNSIFDITAPSVVLLSPENESNLLGNKVSLSIEFDEEIYSQPGKKLRLYRNQEITPFVEMDASEGIINEKVISFAIAQELPDNSVFYVSVEGAAFLDAFDNPSTEIQKKEWSFNTPVSVVLGAQADSHESTNLVYPLPTNGALNVKSDIEEIEIYDIQGKLIKLPFHQSTIDLSNLPSGIYLAKVRTGGEVRIIRVLKN